MTITVEAERAWLMVLKQMVENCNVIAATNQSKRQVRAWH
jgi:hypothetical protein